MTQEQIALLINAAVGLITAITAMIVIWNTNHIKAIREEQKNVASTLAQVQGDGHELRKFLMDYRK